MTIRETANALGLKVRTIREWIKTGRIPAEKVGKCWIIKEEMINSVEVQKRADKGRERARRIKAGKSMGMLARTGKNPEKSI